MKDTIVVFVGIGIILFLPILYYCIKNIISSNKKGGSSYLYYKLAGGVLLSVALIALLVSVYKYTIGNQMPLVAEKYLETEGYAYIKGQGYDISDYEVYLSENVFENDNGATAIYSKFEKDGEDLFTIIDMQKGDKGWEVLSHHIITGDYENYPGIKKRFYPIKAAAP